MSQHQSFFSNKKQWLLILGIAVIAFNLRPAITSVGPVIASIRTDFGLSNGTAGLITTLPLLSFALLSPLAPKIGQKLGFEGAIVAGLFVLFIGILLRATGLLSFLFIGTALIGIGIAICNVLLPGLAKLHFPLKVGLITSVYSTLMSVFAALASGITVPLAEGVGLGWNTTLLLWAALVLVGLAVWVPQLRGKNSEPSAAQVQPLSSSLWRSAIAWQVTLFMGLQSFLFYSSVAWLPEIMQSHGMEVATAGWMLSLMQFAGLPGNFLAPILAGRMTDQRALIIGISILYTLGISGLLIGGSTAFLIVSIILMGLASGSSISLALTLIGLRSATAKQASKLSGMAQSLGYLLAAAGPIAVGLLFDFFHTWTAPLLLFIIILIAMVITGLGAGRNQYATRDLEPTE
ncbi:CynX/NimT family MFS transporter [Alkalicoccobacillus murimartini]|uniref:CP family cyanate transporter-like MFS transporter n=1 Tax=Alkalicoccobacillus murimartini TaxID=171685 RepID=A0ABT9YIU3_9BACI|nr:MFS transporter [Alkalicoccobacillus murimartini]MDQ0207787.1 CP family cyanate transporter-like MFS transporter [Alkalicoccobacillus murimartini]